MWRLIMATLMLSGCVSGAAIPGYQDRPAADCGHVSGSEVGGVARHSARREGAGYISQSESVWTDSLGDDEIGDGPSVRLLHCPSGRGIRIGWSQASAVSPDEFIELMRGRGMLNIGETRPDPRLNPNFAAFAAQFGLKVTQTQAGPRSAVAACGCRLRYPGMTLPWAPKP